jgi:hypothetical protein
MQATSAKRKMLQTYPVGAKIILNDDVAATVSGVCVRANEAVTYEVVYWSGSSRHCEWVQSFEVQGFRDTKDTNSIGFHKQGDDK